MRFRFSVLLAVSGALAVPAGAAAANADIGFRDFEYLPKDVRIAPGESVTWTPQTGSSFDGHPLKSVVSDGEDFGKAGGVAAYSKTFAAAGRFRFYCVFHGTSDGASGMVGKVVVTTNSPPSAAFTVDGTDASTGVFRFDASGPGGSSDPDMGQTLNYAWSFGDGQSQAASPNATTSHTYARGTSPADYTVRLTVTDSNGDAVGPESASTTRTVTVPAQVAGGSQASTSITGTTTTGTGSGDRVAPRVTLTLPTRLRTSLSIRSNEPGRATATLRAGRVVLARGKTVFTKAGLRRVTLVRTVAGRRRLARSRSIKAVLTVRVADTARNATTIRRKAILRR